MQHKTGKDNAKCVTLFIVEVSLKDFNDTSLLLVLIYKHYRIHKKTKILTYNTLNMK